MSKTAEDVAAAVSAPGQESFKTPDITIPVDDASDDPNRFGGDVDWDKALDDSEDEPEVAAEAAPAVKLAEDEPKPAVDTPVATEEKPKESSPAVSDDEAAAAVVADDEEFQPAAIDSLDTAEETTEDWKVEYTKQKGLARDEVQKRYEFSDEDKDEFHLNPENILPRMAAQVYVDVFESVLAAVNDMLPAKVTQLNSANLIAAQRTEEFYTAWPGLKSVEGQEKVIAIGAVYKQLNKEATPEQFIRDVGTQASVSLGIAIPGVTDITAPVVSEEATPAHVPAATAALGIAPELPKDPRQSDNQFEVLDAGWEDEG